MAPEPRAPLEEELADEDGGGAVGDEAHEAGVEDGLAGVGEHEGGEDVGAHGLDDHLEHEGDDEYERGHLHRVDEGAPPDGAVAAVAVGVPMTAAVAVAVVVVAAAVFPVAVAAGLGGKVVATGRAAPVVGIGRLGLGLGEVAVVLVDALGEVLDVVATAAVALAQLMDAEGVGRGDAQHPHGESVSPFSATPSC